MRRSDRWKMDGGETYEAAPRSQSSGFGSSWSAFAFAFALAREQVMTGSTGLWFGNQTSGPEAHLGRDVGPIAGVICKAGSRTACWAPRLVASGWRHISSATTWALSNPALAMAPM